MNRDHIISRQPSKVVRWGLDCHLRRLAASCPPADVAPPCFPAPIIFFLFHPRTFVSILFIFGLILFFSFFIPFYYFSFLFFFFFPFLSFLSTKYSGSCWWSIRVISSLISSPRAHRGSRNKTQDTCVASGYNGQCQSSSLDDSIVTAINLPFPSTISCSLSTESSQFQVKLKLE